MLIYEPGKKHAPLPRRRCDRAQGRAIHGGPVNPNATRTPPARTRNELPRLARDHIGAWTEDILVGIYTRSETKAGFVSLRSMLEFDRNYSLMETPQWVVIDSPGCRVTNPSPLLKQLVAPVYASITSAFLICDAIGTVSLV
jgi:hypothetical protein